MNNLWWEWFRIFDELSAKPRAWWVKRWIPLVLCESVLEHCLGFERACRIIVESWIVQVENPKRFVKIPKYHDVLEYPPDIKDITPSCLVTDEEKIATEYMVLEIVRQILWIKWEEICWMLEEFIEQKTPDSKLLRVLDVTQFWVKAFDYEKIWFKKVIDEFPPPIHQSILEYTKQYPKLDNIYRILLEREFSNFPSNFLYFKLLELKWDYEKFREYMKSLVTGR